jgi:hypothetical protein
MKSRSRSRSTSGRARVQVHFDMSHKYDLLNKLTSINCENVLDHFSESELENYARDNFHLGVEHASGATDLCRALVKIAPHAAREIKYNLNSEEDLFLPRFFHFDYHEATTTGPLHANSDEKQWKSALAKVDKKNAWINRIYKELHTLNDTPTGNMILKLISTLWTPGEITVTNENPTRLSANIYSNTLNIPSVPRFICYYDPKKNLINSQLWMALGHELIHLIHERLGLHYHENPTSEEENTVQGVVNEDTNIDNSLYDVNGEEWHLTENQFRSEHNILPRNGYDSLAVCSSFEKEGCDLYNKYGDDTCQVLQTSEEPRVKKLFNHLKSKHNK